MARTDYGAILSTRIADTSQAIRDVNGTSGLIAPADWGTQIRTMKSASDYQNALEQMIEETASGAIAHFTDGANNIPVKSLVAEINPVQDLHGYDSPWVGGAGKNKLNPALLLDQTAWNQISLTLKPNTNYIMSTNTPRDEAIDLALYFFNSTGNPGTATRVYSEHPVTITTNEDGIVQIQQRRVSGTDSFANYNWQIEEGSSATAWTPYENICPITGHDKAKIYHSGADMRNPVEILIALGQTVYGGSLNVTTGLLTITHVLIESYDGESIGTPWICDRAVYETGTTPPTGSQVVYPLATPITIQLTPTEIKTLLGENNIWADTGDVEVTYRANGNLYVAQH